MKPEPPERIVDAPSVRGGHHRHRNVPVRQRLKQRHRPGLRHRLLPVEILHFLGDPRRHFFPGQRKTVVVDQILRPGQGRFSKKDVPQPRLCLDPETGQIPGAVVVPGGHGVQQCAVHIEHHTLQIHFTNLDHLGYLLPSRPE